MATVHIKGKTLVAGGRFRGKDIQGESIRWSADERTVEVDEANAAAILGDSMLMAIRFDPNAPASASGGASPDQREAELLERIALLEKENEKLRAEAVPSKAAPPAEKPKGK